MKIKPRFFAGQILIATPKLHGTYFAKTIIYITDHDEYGAMGFVINLMLKEIDRSMLFEYLNVKYREVVEAFPIYLGGPVDPERGYILHSNDYYRKVVGDKEPLPTAMIGQGLEMLDDIVKGKGAKYNMLISGYSGWEAGQLEQEVRQSNWIPLEVPAEFIFSGDVDKKWEEAMKMLRINECMMCPATGNA